MIIEFDVTDQAELDHELAIRCNDSRAWDIHLCFGHVYCHPYNRPSDISFMSVSDTGRTGQNYWINGKWVKFSAAKLRNHQKHMDSNDIKD